MSTKLYNNGASINPETDTNSVLKDGVSVESRLATLESSIQPAEEVVESEVECSLAVNSGGQTVYIPTNTFSGSKVTISLSSEVDNTGYFRYTLKNGAKTISTSAAISSNLKNGYELTYEAEENVSHIDLYVRGVAVAGTLTAEISETRKSIAQDTKVDVKCGKNLCDPSQITKGVRVFTLATLGKALVGVPSDNVAASATTGYIPIKNGETLSINKSTPSSGFCNYALFKNAGDSIAIDGTMATKDSSGKRIVTNSLGYNAYVVFSISATDEDVMVVIGNAATEVSFVPFNPIGGYIESEEADYSDYGTIGKVYPEEIADIIKIFDSPKNSNVVRFIHVSDNHGKSFGGAEEFVDFVQADFLVNTGDLVADKYTDDYSGTLAKLLTPSVPSYITLGNHDCSKSSSVSDRFSKFFPSSLLSHNNQSGLDKTYYKVDFATQKLRCLFLDESDGIEDSSLGMNYYSRDTKMSQTQINWFISQLKDAKTNDYGVACFIHCPITGDGKDDQGWSDYQTLDKATSLRFLATIVDAWQRSTSFKVTHDGNTYADSFSGAGMFVGWFSGHTHCDWNGFDKEFIMQHSLCVPRPFANSDILDGTKRTTDNDVTFNYVMIDTKSRRVIVYRVGQQNTWMGGKRTSYYYCF